MIWTVQRQWQFYWIRGGVGYIHQWYEVVLGFGSKSSWILNFRGLELLISSSKLYCPCEQLWFVVYTLFSFEDLLSQNFKWSFKVIFLASVLFIFKDGIYTQLHDWLQLKVEFKGRPRKQFHLLCDIIFKFSSISEKDSFGISTIALSLSALATHSVSEPDVAVTGPEVILVGWDSTEHTLNKK